MIEGSRVSCLGTRSFGGLDSPMEVLRRASRVPHPRPFPTQGGGLYGAYGKEDVADRKNSAKAKRADLRKRAEDSMQPSDSPRDSDLQGSDDKELPSSPRYKKSWDVKTFVDVVSDVKKFLVGRPLLPPAVPANLSITGLCSEAPALLPVACRRHAGLFTSLPGLGSSF